MRSVGSAGAGLVNLLKVYYVAIAWLVTLWNESIYAIYSVAVDKQSF